MAGRSMAGTSDSDRPVNSTPTPDEVAELLREYDTVKMAPAPKPKRTRAGCLVSVLAVYALFAFQGANRGLGLGIPRRTVALLALFLLSVAVLGVVLQFLVSALAHRTVASQRALDALTHLTNQFSESSDEANRRAVVTLLADAYITGRGTTVAAFDFDEAKRSLGPALPYVQEVEQVLREERQMYPVFTS